MSVILVLKPKTQLDKARDGQRQSDLQQIRNALDMYYNDNDSYPSNLTFGSQWNGSGSTVYMKEVPQDPDSSPSYQYHAANSGSQWAVAYVKLAVSTGDCPLTKLANCLPQNWDNQWSCILLGKIDDSDVSGPCSVIGGETMP